MVSFTVPPSRSLVGATRWVARRIARIAFRLFPRFITLSYLGGGVFTIQFPFERIVDYVPPNAVQLALVPDNMFKKSPLPNAGMGHTAFCPNLLRRQRFELSDNRANRSRGRSPRLSAGDAPRRPYGSVCLRYNNNPMQVIRHDREFIHSHVGTHNFRAHPLGLHDVPGVIQLHTPINDLAEETMLVMRTDRHEISAGPRIVIFLQANGPPVWLLGRSHFRRPFRMAPFPDAEHAEISVFESAYQLSQRFAF